MKSILTYLLVFSFLLPHQSKASDDWSATGHRVVGKIAEKYLTHSTKRKIKQLLSDHSLAFESTYADDIKSDKRYSEFYTWHYINMPLEDNYEDSEIIY